MFKIPSKLGEAGAKMLELKKQQQNNNKKSSLKSKKSKKS